MLPNALQGFRPSSHRGGLGGFFLLILLASAAAGTWYVLKAGNVEFQRARVAQVVEMVPVGVFARSEEDIRRHILSNIKTDAPEVSIDGGDIVVSKSGDTLKVSLRYHVPIQAGPLSRDKVVEDVVEKRFSGYGVTPILKAHRAAQQMSGAAKSKADEAARILGGQGNGGAE